VIEKKGAVFVHGAPEGFYAFGDSYTDTGNTGADWVPNGITWPGYPDGRLSDGRNQVDYFGMFCSPQFALLNTMKDGTKECRKLVTTYLTLFELGCACFKGTWQGSRDGRTLETWL
jgi:hypothetical protein